MASYWSKEMDQIICKYLVTEHIETKEKIFTDSIYPVLYKLADSVIKTFDFIYLKNPIRNPLSDEIKITRLVPLPDYKGIREDLILDVVGFLTLQLPKYRASKGKSFSYFTIIAKNYLVRLNEIEERKYRQELQFEPWELFVDNNENTVLPEAFKVYPKEELSNTAQSFVTYWKTKGSTLIKKERDKKIVKALLDIIANAESLDTINKKVIFQRLREQTKCTTPHIAKALVKMKRHLRNVEMV